MFAIVSTAVLALAATAAAAPSRIARSAPVAVISSGPSGGSSSSLSSGLGSFSLNGWGGCQSLNNFDNFYGSSNFDGSSNSQTVLSETVTCQTQTIVEVQQQLSILTEFAKRVVLTQVCEVEAQTIVWSQFVSSIQSFSSDFRHVSGRSIGYDSHIASYISQLVDSNDNIIHKDYGFQGSDIGSSLIAPSGYNWQSGSSQISVQQALIASQVSQLQSSSSIISSSSLGHSGSIGGFSGLGVSSGTYDVSSF